MTRLLILASLLIVGACSARQDANKTDQGGKNNNSNQPHEVAVGSFVASGPGGVILQSYEFGTVITDQNGAVADRRKANARYYVEDILGVGLEMVEISGGKFSMGSSLDDDEQPVHQVSVASFHIGKYEVTQAQWRAAASLPKVSRDLDPDPSRFKGDNLPVERVSWKAAMEFCARISNSTGRTYRLPSEGQWEYACRGATTTEFSFGPAITPELVNYKGVRATWQDASSTAGYRERTTPVGSVGVANGFGLFDMHGNVAEWCLDYHQFGYVGARLDGAAWKAPQQRAREKSDDMRIARGGCWFDGSDQCRATYRGSAGVDDRRPSHGFRVVEQAPNRTQREAPLWSVSDKARRAVETFLAAHTTYRLLKFEDIPKSLLEHEDPGQNPRFSGGYDLQQVDMSTRALAEGDANGDGRDEALAIVVTGESDQRLYSVICLNGSQGTGYDPVPFWIVKDSSDFIGKAYVEASVFDKKYNYRTPPTVYVVYDLDFSYERSDNDFHTWNGKQYEQAYFVAGEHVECPDEVKLYSQPNPSSKVVKVFEAGTALLVLSSISTAVVGVNDARENPNDYGRHRWYRVLALKNNRATQIVGFVAGDQVTRWAEEH